MTCVRPPLPPSPATRGHLHEEVGNPHGVEEVPRSLQLVPVVLLQVEEGHDVCVPRLEVDRDRTLALPSSLADVTRNFSREPLRENVEGWRRYMIHLYSMEGVTLLLQM